jgi:HlyD family secretion protein
LAKLAALLALLGFALAAGCRKRADPKDQGYQGIVEFDERKLGFEVGGRLAQVFVRRGQEVQEGALLAKLDDELESAARQARVGEAEAAHAEVELLEAGSRPEEIRSMSAQVQAARASEELLKKKVVRERELNARGVTPQAALDEVEAQLERATAERLSLEQKLSSLRRGARKEEVERAKARASASRSSVTLEEVRLGRHELRAALSGQVLDVHFDQGEIVGAALPVVTLADTHHPYAEVFVPQAELAGIRQNTKALVRVDSLSQQLPAHVEYVSQRTEFTPRFLFSEQERPNLVIRVRVRIDDGAQRLHAGVPAFITFPGLGAQGGNHR